MRKKVLLRVALVVAACLVLALGLGSGAGGARSSGVGYVIASGGPDGVLGTADDVYANGQGEVRTGAVDLAVAASSQFVPSCAGGAAPATPRAPGGLRVTGVTDRSVSLAWDPVQGANFYRVYADGALAAEVQSNVATVDGLAPATQYVFEVAAVGMHEGSKSAPVGVLTAPAAPAGLRATGTTSTSVSLAWDPVQGAASYKVYVNGAFKTAAQSNSAEIQGLTPNTGYAFAVSAVGAEGSEGPVSSPLEAITAPAEPSVVTQFTYSAVIDPSYGTVEVLGWNGREWLCLYSSPTWGNRWNIGIDRNKNITKLQTHLRLNYTPKSVASANIWRVVLSDGRVFEGDPLVGASSKYAGEYYSAVWSIP